jgi:lipopolysaccharide heptosyltransferase I
VKRILIVRMSALGDIVHALPVLAAIRNAMPDVDVDWLADRRYIGLLDYVDGIAQRVVGRPELSKAVASMRPRGYDVAIDLQGLLKSAAMARLSGAERIVGFERTVLRERAAAWFYSECASVAPGAHVIQKNLAVLPLLGIAAPPAITFPFRIPHSTVASEMSNTARLRGHRGFALINPGAAWPNKRWPAERFGAVAQHIEREHELSSLVLWGAGESELADAVVAASGSSAQRAPETTLGDVLALAARASLMVSGDTGPLHIAAALGTPVVGLYGPTWPERNGPWRADDEVVSRAAQCECHHKRQCLRSPAVAQMCLNDVTVAEVCSAVDRRQARFNQG